MSAQRRTQIIVVGGALAIASAAYGLGTQAGGGTAVADNNQDNERGARVMLARGPCGPSALADDLGGRSPHGSILVGRQGSGEQQRRRESGHGRARPTPRPPATE